jgi:hypothetical protein
LLDGGTTARTVERGKSPSRTCGEDDPLVVELGDGLLMDHMFRL